MEIVIKIDDERYKDIQRIAEVQLDRGRFQTAEQVIANGIPLPKGFGRLNGRTYAYKCGLEDGKRKALEQEPRKDEVILTNKEYRELMANEYDHGYCKGYAVALEEQESILNKIRAEIAEYGSILVAYAITGHSDRDIENLIEGVLKKAKEQVLNIIDKYRTESEE